MSFGEPIALRGQVDLEQVASATPGDARSATELQFIEQLKTGDLLAFDKLVADRSGEIYGLLYRLTEDSEEARDLTQETFLRAFQNIARFRGDSDLKTWLYRIAINQARNRWRWWRRRRKDFTVSIDAETDDGIPALANSLIADGGNNPERESLARERETLLRTALRSLAPSYREAVVLRDIQGLTYEEIATALDITVGTVKSRISRGRDELRKRLDGMF